MTLCEFYNKLKVHDWFYDFSDDNEVYLRGRTVRDKLLREVAINGEPFGQLYRAMHDHHFSGEPWNTEKQPMPERPEEK